MPAKDSFELSEKLSTDLKKINPFLDLISQKIMALAGSKEEVFKVKLALEEALTNAMRHGNAMDPALEVTVCIEASRKKIILDVHDQGEGFDFAGIPDPTSSDCANRPSGRGVFLMRKLMDEVEFYDGGSGIKMIKFFPRKEV
jgi:serine/threonine-protein kinase RsbW